MKGILAVGDCNTLGTTNLAGKSYPELVGSTRGCSVTNCSFTMSTSREGLHLLKDNLTNDFDWVFIQFGLVDSYHTFKYSPYILYYPENFIRKQLRSLVKKYKKTCRNMGLHKKLGSVNVVPIKEYRENLTSMILLCENIKVILPETIPHHEKERNKAIQNYNRVLKELSKEYDNCYSVELYNDFAANIDTYYSDTTHSNDNGHAHIARMISKVIIQEQ